MRKMVLFFVALTILALPLLGCSGGKAGEPFLDNPPVITGPVLLDSHLTLKGYGGKRTYGDQWSAQVFVPLSNWDVQSVRLKLWVDGVVPSFNVSLVEIAGGRFGRELDLNEVGVSNMVVFDPGAMVEIPITSKLVGGQSYAIVVYMDGGNENNSVRWLYDTGGTGGYYYSGNGGLDWQQVVDRDFVFEIWGVVE